MLNPNDAESIILNLAQPLDAHRAQERVPLSEADGRILATDVTGDLDIPHWDNSAMDGYAVRFEDVKECSPEHPGVLTVVEEIPAGYAPQQTVQPGQTARILTGGVMPEGADTVVIQEDVTREGDRLLIASPPQPQAFVRHQAAFYKAGTPLLSQGVRLGAPEIAVLAAAQCAVVPVYRRLTVAIFSTGSELVSPDQTLQRGQIVDSNQYALASLVRAAGAVPLSLGIVPDEPEALKTAISRALSEADVILSSGGVSVGDYDYVDRILEELGAQIHIRSVAVKPGKPLTVATLQASQPEDTSAMPPSSDVLYFGLPGNPVSALVSFWRFVQPALRKRSGLKGHWRPVFVKGRSPHLLRSGGQRETYLWGKAHLVDGAYEFSLAGGSHSSGNLINLAGTNALAVVPIGQTSIQPGDSIQILLLDRQSTNE